MRARRPLSHFEPNAAAFPPVLVAAAFALTPPALVALVAAVLALSPPASAAAAAPGGQAAPALSVSPRHHAAARFWTAARLRRAQPLAVHPAPPTGPAAAAPLASADGARPGRVAPLDPAGAAASDAFDPVDASAAGNRISGAVFVALAGGIGVARCSGTSVSAANRSVVFTAGHCVYEGGSHGRWVAGKWVFIPGYRDGERPFGVFPAKWLGTTRPWLRHGSENGDVGAAVVGRNERGERLADAVGAAGIAWGLSPRQSFDIHGYPVGRPFNGSSQRLCAATPYLGHDFGSFFWPGPLNLAVDCPVTGGASGGGWLIDGTTLNSVTDYGYDEDPRTDYGAYFGAAVRDLYRRAARVR